MNPIASAAAPANTPAPERRLIVGCDFSSAPTKRKPIVMALGHAARGRVVVLDALESLTTLEAFADWLAAPRKMPGVAATGEMPSVAATGDVPWVGAFDFPFGLPRELVESLGWPTDWLACIAHYASLTRAEIRASFAAFCDARPVGGKFAHRAFDRAAGSSPPMKWVNPPVAFMLHAAVPRLVAAGVDLPGLHAGDPRRVALEAYPGLLARELIGARSYKNDAIAKQTPERLIARKDLVNALELGRSRLGMRLKLSHAQRDALAQDASGDRLDAVLCLVQAAWADAEGPPRWGLPAEVDPLEGWILTV